MICQLLNSNNLNGEPTFKVNDFRFKNLIVWFNPIFPYGMSEFVLNPLFRKAGNQDYDFVVLNFGDICNWCRGVSIRFFGLMSTIVS